MAKIMNDEQRLKVLEAYEPKDHLIEVARDKDTRKPVLYYPAAWRLWELRLRHPHFTLEAEIIHIDADKNTVIVQAIGYDGTDYASSDLKGKALKQGKLSDLDKVETKAKARVIRDCGIGTEYALDMTADETDATHDDDLHNQKPPVNKSKHAASAPNELPIPINAPTPKALRERHKFLGMNDDFDTVVFKIFKREVPDEDKTPEQCVTISGVLERFYEKNNKAR